MVNKLLCMCRYSEMPEWGRLLEKCLGGEDLDWENGQGYHNRFAQSVRPQNKSVCLESG